MFLLALYASPWHPLVWSFFFPLSVPKVFVAAWGISRKGPSHEGQAGTGAKHQRGGVLHAQGKVVERLQRLEAATRQDSLVEIDVIRFWMILVRILGFVWGARMRLTWHDWICWLTVSISTWVLLQILSSLSWSSHHPVTPDSIRHLGSTTQTFASNTVRFLRLRSKGRSWTEPALVGNHAKIFPRSCHSQTC